jgi:hypothetical protein
MLKVLREVTADWAVDTRLPNHTYLINGDVVVAYKPWHEDPIQHLKSGKIKLDKRYRKFKELPFIAADWGMEDEQTAPSNIVTVEGSNGNTYEVDVDVGSCTCPGYTFRGKCKHVELAKSRLALAA